MIEMAVQGADQIERRLNALPKKVARKAVTKALRAGMNYLKPLAKAETPVAKEPTRLSGGRYRMPGALRKSVKVRTAKRNRPGTYAVLLSTSASDSLYQGATYYGGFIHFGRKIGRRRGNVQKAYGVRVGVDKRGRRYRRKVVQTVADARTGKVEPNPFLARAFKKSGNAAATIIERTLMAGIEAAAMEKA